MSITETKTELSTEQQAWLRDAGAMLRFLEAHPDLWPDYYAQPIRLYKPVMDYQVDDVLAHMASVAREMAPCEKDAGENTQGDFHLTKYFGQHHLVVYTNRENVCTKRVVGTEVEEVEGYADEDQAVIDALPKVTKTVEVEKVEWDCPSLLSHG